MLSYTKNLVFEEKNQFIYLFIYSARERQIDLQMLWKNAGNINVLTREKDFLKICQNLQEMNLQSYFVTKNLLAKIRKKIIR